ncbi:MAG: hypothetical protein NTW19_02625, partial [Planctomycetota bacterium]|nr:hypothetical protein [Planctomycetota bacterium]
MTILVAMSLLLSMGFVAAWVAQTYRTFGVRIVGRPLGNLQVSFCAARLIVKHSWHSHVWIQANLQHVDIRALSEPPENWRWGTLTNRDAWTCPGGFGLLHFVSPCSPAPGVVIPSYHTFL